MSTRATKRPAARKKRSQGGPRTYGRLQRALDDAARSEISAALREAGGDTGAAAELLGISRMGLWKRMRALGLTVDGK